MSVEWIPLFLFLVKTLFDFIRERMAMVWWDGWFWGFAWTVPAFVAGLWWAKRKSRKR